MALNKKRPRDEDDDREEREERSAKKKRRDDDDDFEYQERTAEDVQRRATQSGGSYDSYIDTKIPTFKPKSGTNTIRILPIPRGAWEGSDKHYGYEIWVHRDIGPDHGTYLCAKKMKDEECPICDARREEESSGDADAVSKLKPQKRVLVWLIDRDEESSGPKLWSMPWTVDKDIAMRCVNKRTGAIIPIDHPDEGCDVEFTKEGEGKKTNYVGVEISRETGPISEKESVQKKWLRYVKENPIPDLLVFYETEYLASVYAGTAEAKDPDLDEDEDEDEDSGRSKRRRLRQEVDEDDEPKKKKSKKKDEEDDEDEEEKPRKRHRDGDGDEDEEDDEEEEDEPKKKKSKKKDEEDDEEEEEPKKKRRDDDEEDDEEEEEEDDEPKKKEKTKRDEEEEEDEEDDEEDDEPKKKKKTKKDEEEEDDPPPEEDEDEDEDSEATERAKARLERLKKRK